MSTTVTVSKAVTSLVAKLDAGIDTLSAEELMLLSKAVEGLAASGDLEQAVVAVAEKHINDAKAALEQAGTDMGQAKVSMEQALTYLQGQGSKIDNIQSSVQGTLGQLLSDTRTILPSGNKLLTCNGAVLDANVYPLLAAVLPDNYSPYGDNQWPNLGSSRSNVLNNAATVGSNDGTKVWGHRNQSVSSNIESGFLDMTGSLGVEHGASYSQPWGNQFAVWPVCISNDGNKRLTFRAVTTSTQIPFWFSSSGEDFKTLGYGGKAQTGTINNPDNMNWYSNTSNVLAGCFNNDESKIITALLTYTSPSNSANHHEIHLFSMDASQANPSAIHMGKVGQGEVEVGALCTLDKASIPMVNSKLYALSASNDGNVVAFSGNNTGNLLTTDGGATFKKIGDMNWSSSAKTYVSGDGQTIVFMGANSTSSFLLSEDGGNTFTEYNMADKVRALIDYSLASLSWFGGHRVGNIYVQPIGLASGDMDTENVLVYFTPEASRDNNTYYLHMLSILNVKTGEFSDPIMVNSQQKSDTSTYYPWPVSSLNGGLCACILADGSLNFMTIRSTSRYHFKFNKAKRLPLAPNTKIVGDK